MFRAILPWAVLLTVGFLSSCNLSVQPGDAGNGGSDNGGGDFDDVVIRARVRNESQSQADITLRFLTDNQISGLSFVRVPPDTITTISGPGASVIELSGINENGDALEFARLTFGIDFDESRVAEYVVKDPASPPDPPAPHPAAPKLELGPLSKTEVLVGQTITLNWTDSGSAESVISLFLRPAGKQSPLIPLGPAISAALDGLNDSLVAVVEGAQPGEYEVVGRIDDGDQTVFSVAAGTLRVKIDAGNAAPTISLVQNDPQVVRSGETVLIKWIDQDDDDNATINFFLSAQGGGIGSTEFAISPPIAEDMDLRPVDSVTLTIHGVLPGVYDITARIDDGNLAGTSRALAAVHVVPTTENDFPNLRVVEPATGREVTKGGSFQVRWTDSDGNDNALIWFLLDADPQTSLLNGNEYVLAAAISEDPDGAGDQISLIVPADVAAGVYRLVAVISDGLTQVVTRAAGSITVRPAGSGGGGSQGGGDGGGNGGGGSGSTQITLVPSAEIVHHPGELITVLVSQPSEAPLARRSKVFLTNQAYGGTFSLDVTPHVGPAPTTKTFSLVIDSGVVPNIVWPRSFDIVIETIIDGNSMSFYSPRPIWIWQNVELLSVKRVNYVCHEGDTLISEPSDFVGIEWTWYGGGFTQADAGVIAFWFTNDGTVPPDQVEDSGHKVATSQLASPNQIRADRVTLDSLLGLHRAPIIVVETSPTIGLESDWYWITPVFDPDGENHVLATFPSPIRVCEPVDSLIGP